MSCEVGGGSWSPRCVQAFQVQLIRRDVTSPVRAGAASERPLAVRGRERAVSVDRGAQT